MTELTTNEKEAQRLILIEIRKSHELLEKHLQKFCDDTGAKAVPMAYIKASQKILLEGLEKGAKKEK